MIGIVRASDSSDQLMLNLWGFGPALNISVVQAVYTCNYLKIIDGSKVVSVSHV